MATGAKLKTKVPARPARPLWLVYLVAWLVPGGGHLWLGRRHKGLVFLLVLPAMFGIGLALRGRLFPFEPAEPLVALAAVADVGVGAAYALAKLAGLGAGVAGAVTYEYGNAFLITAGLLNTLVMIDAHDIALGRK
ncbi:MAG: DUF6677 family protein [Acidobacteriota bacterium]